MSAHVQSPYSDSDTESPLDFPVPQVPGDESVASPRTELLSTSSSRGNAVATVDSRRERRRATQERHRNERERELTRITHRKDLVAMLINEEAEVKKLRKALLSAVTRLQGETQKVAELERGNRGVAERFRMLNESKLAAEQQATQVLQELEIYKLQLENSQREIVRAQEALGMIERQRDDAEASAARAREKARKLKQQQVVSLAREEGRRLGFEEGLRRGQEEFRSRVVQAGQAVPPIPPTTTQNDVTRSFDNATRLGGSTEQTGEDDDIISSDSDSQTNIVPPETINDRRTSQSAPAPAIEQIPPNIRMEPPTPPAQSQQPPSHAPPFPEPSPGPPLIGIARSDKSATPSIQPFRIHIPPTEELQRQFGGNEGYHGQPRNEWVTAGQHLQINGIPPSPQGPRLSPNAQAGPSNSPMGPPPGPGIPPNMPPGYIPSGPMPPHNMLLGNAHPISGPKGPILKRPTISPITPTSAKARGITWGSLRRPSLAGAKASSWYRSLSFRKKNKPIIDPDPEEEIQQRAPQPQSPSRPANSDSPDERNLYKYQPPTRQSWYQGPNKLGPPPSLKAHSRRAASIDSGSTRISNYTILGTPHVGNPNRPVQNGISSGASTSGRSAKSANQRLNAKESLLSVIKEDPGSRVTTPMSDRFLSSSGRPRASSEAASSSLGPITQPNFGSRGKPSPGPSLIAIDHSKLQPLHRPTRLQFPQPLAPQTGTPTLLAGATLHPESARLDRQGSKSQRSPGPTPTTGGTIGIDVQPPSQSASPSEARTPAIHSDNYLSPNSSRVPLPQRVNLTPSMFNNTPRSQHGALSPDFAPQFMPPSNNLSVKSSGTRRASPMMNSTSLPVPPRTPSPHPSSVRMSTSQHGNPEISQSRSPSNTPKIFQAQLPRPNTPKIFQAQQLQGVPRTESVHSSASRRNGPTMTPAAQPNVLPDTLSDGRNLHRASSNTSLRSMGSYSHFDPTSYVDPALWGPDGVPPPHRPPSQLSRRHSRAMSANSALSYLTEQTPAS